MKRNWLLFFIFLIFVGLNITFYTLGFVNGVKKAQNLRADKIDYPLRADKIDYPLRTGKIDYPLIDVAFDDETQLVVIIRDGLFTNNEKILISQNTQCLQINKENLSVLTFPVGRGTTPLGIVYVFKNGELIREIPYTEIKFENDDIKNGFEISCEEHVQKLIGDFLPSPV